ncbi:MAG: CDP-alcohol phosphatidyltransferase family protein [Candidatus Omnitrophica bacterium]|nr:CDP-alcohol phosphatidyltransferase family protein [Candidatus Omnitrophota bacterium]
MNTLLRQSANLITLLRVLFVFGVIYLLKSSNPLICLWGVLLLQIIFFMDGLDGYIAKKTKSVTAIGGLIDTLGDRITENLLLIFFAALWIIPMYVPLIFVARSLAADFVRSLSFKHGHTTFSVNTSLLGYIFVASKASRIIYLLMKFFLFTLGAITLFLMRAHNTFDVNPTTLAMLRHITVVMANILVFVNLLRFVLLIYDSRNVLKENFLNGPAGQ